MTATMPCPEPGCTGTIGETGFCDMCGLAARQPSEQTVPLDRPVSTARSTQPGGVSDPYSLPVFSFPDPSSRIISDPRVPERERVCAKCGDPVGRSYKGQPALAKGACPMCGHPYSFLPSLREGDLVGGQYRVVGCFARGGLGWVYLAHDENLDGNLVALKGLIDASDASTAVAERRALTMLNHPNIVRIFNFVRHPDQHTGEDRDYIVMEYVDGLPLRYVCTESKRGGRPLGEPLRVEHVISCGLQILAAFEYLHGRRLLYCDMKPDNVIMRSGQHGEKINRISLIDLGAVRGFDDRTSKIIGTQVYQVSQREIGEHGLSVRSDLHTVGVTLRELFEATVDSEGLGSAGNPLEVGLKSFTMVIARATDSYERRFASAAEMAGQLRGVYRRIAALRDGRSRPEPSTVYAQAAALLDAGLGVGPLLDSWVEGGRPLDEPAALPRGMPAPSAVATALPVPFVDPDDPHADFLVDVDALDARGLLGKLAGLESVEVDLARCRAHLELGESDEAMRSLSRARTQAGDWRLEWHDGLVALARDDVQRASACFQAVHAALPGEDTPLLALAYCHEASGEPVEADKNYRAVWLRDRAQVGAAFGLTRLALAQGKRGDALAELEDVPGYSRHADAAGIAQVLIRSHPVGDRPPSEEDLAKAAARLSGLHLDGGEPDGDARARLTTVVREAVLHRLPAAGGRLSVDGGEVFGDRPDETAARRLLERSYQSLARQARDADAHGVLVDRANRVRPITFL